MRDWVSHGNLWKQAKVNGSIRLPYRCEPQVWTGGRGEMEQSMERQTLNNRKAMAQQLAWKPEQGETRAVDSGSTNKHPSRLRTDAARCAEEARQRQKECDEHTEPIRNDETEKPRREVQVSRGGSIYEQACTDELEPARRPRRITSLLPS